MLALACKKTTLDRKVIQSEGKLDIESPASLYNALVHDPINRSPGVYFSLNSYTRSNVVPTKSRQIKDAGLQACSYREFDTDNNVRLFKHAALGREHISVDFASLWPQDTHFYLPVAGSSSPATSVCLSVSVIAKTPLLPTNVNKGPAKLLATSEDIVAAQKACCSC